MSTEAYQNETHSVVAPALVTCNPNVLVTGSLLECSVRRFFGSFYYNAPLASTVVAPANVERGR
jgi:hypothetical protein